VTGDKEVIHGLSMAIGKQISHAINLSTFASLLAILKIPASQNMKTTNRKIYEVWERQIKIDGKQ